MISVSGDPVFRSESWYKRLLLCKKRLCDQVKLAATCHISGSCGSCILGDAITNLSWDIPSTAYVFFLYHERKAKMVPWQGKLVYLIS